MSRNQQLIDLSDENIGCCVSVLLPPGAEEAEKLRGANSITE